MHSHGPLNSASAFLTEAFCQPYNLEVIPSPVLLYSTLAFFHCCNYHTVL